MRPPSVRFYRSYASGHAGLAEHRSRTRPWHARGVGVQVRGALAAYHRPVNEFSLAIPGVDGTDVASPYSPSDSERWVPEDHKSSSVIARASCIPRRCAAWAKRLRCWVRFRTISCVHASLTL